MGYLSKMNFVKTIILSNFALLIFILNIPGTIALRNILAVSLLSIVISQWAQKKISIKPILTDKNYRDNFILLSLLTIYIFFHSIFIADEVSWSLSQYRTQWVYPMIYFMMGVSLASMASIHRFFRIETLIAVLFYSLLIHVIYIDMVAIFNYFKTGTLLSRYGGLTQSPVLSSYIANILISMIIVEYIYRLRKRKKILKIESLWLTIFLFICIFSTVIGGMRFGAISLFFMSLTGFILIIIDNDHFNNKAKGFVTISILILCTLPLLYNAKSDERWLSLLETIPIAIDTENNTFWRDRQVENHPRLANGRQVNDSNYLRIAWAAKGVEYIKNDIFGIGYGRNVFGHAIQKYEKSSESIRGNHSHSGIVDFTIGVGIIGLLFWVFFVAKIIVYSIKIFLKSGNYFSLLSLFITSGFFIRSIVDSNMRDHMFKQFFLILGISLTLAAYEFNKKMEDA